MIFASGGGDEILRSVNMRENSSSMYFRMSSFGSNVPSNTRARVMSHNVLVKRFLNMRFRSAADKET